MKKSKSNNQSKQNKPVTKQQVRSMIKSDKVDLIKYIDTIVTMSNTSSTEATSFLNMPAVGNSQNDRSADSITISHFEVCMSDFFGDGIITSGDALFERIMLYQNCGEAIISNSSSLLDLVSTADAKFNSPLNYSNNHKLFKMLLDQRFHLDTFNPTIWKRYSRIKPSISKVRYDAFNAQWSTGYPNLTICRDIPAISGGSTVQLTVVVRMWFYDV